LSLYLVHGSVDVAQVVGVRPAVIGLVVPADHDPQLLLDDLADGRFDLLFARHLVPPPLDRNDRATDERHRSAAKPRPRVGRCRAGALDRDVQVLLVRVLSRVRAPAPRAAIVGAEHDLPVEDDVVDARVTPGPQRPGERVAVQPPFRVVGHVDRPDDVARAGVWVVVRLPLLVIGVADAAVAARGTARRKTVDLSEERLQGRREMPCAHGDSPSSPGSSSPGSASGSSSSNSPRAAGCGKPASSSSVGPSNGVASSSPDGSAVSGSGGGGGDIWTPSSSACPPPWYS